MATIFKTTSFGNSGNKPQAQNESLGTNSSKMPKDLGRPSFDLHLTLIDGLLSNCWEITQNCYLLLSRKRFASSNCSETSGRYSPWRIYDISIVFNTSWKLDWKKTHNEIMICILACKALNCASDENCYQCEIGNK